MQESDNPIYEFLGLLNVNINHVMGLENNKPSLCTSVIQTPKCIYNLHKCDEESKHPSPRFCKFLHKCDQVNKTYLHK
jgi:hypothetical protein